jgi:hypothetical protein
VRRPVRLLIQLLERAAGGPAHHLADAGADHEAVVAVGRSRLPLRPLVGQPLGDQAGVGEFLRRDLAVHPAHSSIGLVSSLTFALSGRLNELAVTSPKGLEGSATDCTFSQPRVFWYQHR